VEFSGVRRSGAFESLAYTARKCAKMHAANATTQAATAMIEITSSVLTSTPLVSVSGDPFAGEAWARALSGDYESQGNS
jgi:hypothetical protein